MATCIATIEEIIKAAKSLPPEELEQLKSAVDGQAPLAKLEKAAKDIPTAINLFLRTHPNEEDIEIVLGNVDELMEAIADAIEAQAPQRRLSTRSRLLEEYNEEPYCVTKTGETMQITAPSSPGAYADRQFYKAGEVDFVRTFADPSEKEDDSRATLAQQRVWKTQDGTRLLVSDMEGDHLRNSINLLQRKARKNLGTQPEHMADMERYHGMRAMNDHQLASNIYGAQYDMLVEEAVERGMMEYE